MTTKPATKAEKPKKARRGRGEGSIEELADGRWKAWLSLGKNPITGKRMRRAIYGRTKREVQTKLRDSLVAAEKGTLANPGKVTVGEWLDKWLEHRKPNIAPKTYDHDESRVRLHLKRLLGRIPLGKLAAIQVRDMLTVLAKEGQSTSERSKVGGVLRAALNVAVEDGLVAVNVMQRVKLPKVVRPEKVSLDFLQAQALLRTAHGHRFGPLIAFALDSGCRPGEVFAVHWPDVDLEAGSVFVHLSLEERKGFLRLKETKTPKSRRRIPLAKRTVAAIRCHRDRMRREGHDVDRGVVFCDTEGGLLRQSNFLRRALRPMLRKAGLPAIRPYDLRHTCATILLSQGVNVKVVSERLGHDDILTTLKHYAHAMPGMQEKATDTIELLYGSEWQPNGNHLAYVPEYQI